MNPTVTSIFDLSPPEKLQLVEDLWDDLAAIPDAVPVHDWQKEFDFWHLWHINIPRSLGLSLGVRNPHIPVSLAWLEPYLPYLPVLFGE